ncbi:MAG: DUF4231 domain-containing protein [Calditrichaeota bacterium]|nr:MAG: DUF4231 domain-containing protein [Calditrichota bacterium]
MSDDFTYIKERLDAQESWHSAKAATYKKNYYLAETFTLVSGALIPVINVLNFSNPQYMELVQIASALLASVAVVAGGISKLFKFQDNWLNYRGVAEALGREKQFFLMQAEDYEVEDEMERRRILVERVEHILAENTAKFLALHRGKRIGATRQPKTATDGGE